MYYPLMLDLRQFKCLVIGGGQVAYRKVRSLLNYGGQVTVLSESFVPELEALPIEGIVASFEEKYLKAYSKEYALVIAATNDKACNEAIGLYCQKYHILCNIATDEQLSSFIVPSSLRREDLVIAVSTGGNSPALAAKIQRELEATYDEKFGAYVKKLGLLRSQIKQNVSDESERRKLLKGLLEMEQEELMKFEYNPKDFIKDEVTYKR